MVRRRPERAFGDAQLRLNRPPRPLPPPEEPMTPRHPNGREKTPDELEREGEDCRDAVDDEAGDWLAEDDQPRY